MATEPLNFFCTIEPKKYSRPRIKFLGASDDEDSEKEEQLEQDKRSAVKPAEKSKRKPVFADEVFSRPKVIFLIFIKDISHGDTISSFVGYTVGTVRISP